MRFVREVLVSIALLGGWLLITWGVASLTRWQAWPISLGLLLFSLAGWRFLRNLFRDGLYVLTKESTDA